MGCNLAASLVSKGLRVVVCDEPHNCGKFKSRHVAGVFPVPSHRDTLNFIRKVREILDATGARTLIPVFYPEVIASFRESFPDCVLPVDDAGKLTLLDDKVKLYGFAESLGIPQPRRYLEAGQVDRFPAVFKRSSGHGGDSVYFPDNMESLKNLAGNSVPGTFLITGEVDGVDVSVDALRWGDFFFAGAYEVILPKAKGSSVLRRSIEAPQAVAYLRRLLDSLDYRGVCGADFRIDSGGGVWLLECNPRFSGGLGSQIASGFDQPSLLLDLARGREVEAPRFRTGVRTLSLTAAREYFRRRHRQGKPLLRDLLKCMFARIVR